MNAIAEQEWAEITEEWCDAINVWRSARPDGVCQLAGRALEFEWVTDAECAFTVYAMFECLGYRWGIALDSLCAFDARLVGDPFMSMPRTFRSLTVEKLLAEVLESLPVDIACNIDTPVIGWGVPTWPQSWHKLPLLLRNRDQRTVSLGVLAVEKPAGLIWLNQQLPQQQCEKKALPRSLLQCQLPVNIGGTTLPIREIKQLEVGDLILIETAGITRQGLRVFLELPVKDGAQSPVIYHGFVKRRHLILCGTSASNEQLNELALPLSTETEHAMEMDIGNIELPVTFDLGAITLPIAEIERLGEHQILELAGEAAAMRVNVRVHGACVAQGRLMLVGRRLAVRLEKVGMADVTAPA